LRFDCIRSGLIRSDNLGVIFRSEMAFVISDVSILLDPTIGGGLFQRLKITLIEQKVTRFLGVLFLIVS